MYQYFLGDKQGGVCIYPTINCASSQTKYPAKCLLICPTGYTLVGESHLSCQTTGSWKKIQSYCKRDNEPPTNVNRSSYRKLGFLSWMIYMEK